MALLTGWLGGALAAMPMGPAAAKGGEGAGTATSGDAVRARAAIPWLPQPQQGRASETARRATPAVVSGPVDLWVELDLPAGPDRARAITAQQDALMQSLVALGAIELGRVRLAMNAVAVRVDADRLQAIERLPGVKAVRRVRTIERPPVHRQQSSQPANGARVR